MNRIGSVARMDWSHDYFERGYAQRWRLGPPSSGVRSEAGGLCDLLRLAAADRVIDIGCGHGRHAVVIAERGVDVIGIDASASLLRRGQQLGAELGIRVRWVRGDMRWLPFKTGSADAAIMMDVVGFFDTEDEHDRTLREAARVLRTGGRIGLKVLNGRHVLDAFRERDHQESQGTTISISRTLSLDPPRMVERLSFSRGRGCEEYERRQRLYREDELRVALEDAGFDIVGAYASPDGTPFEQVRSSTIWIVGERRAMDDSHGHKESRPE